MGELHSSCHLQADGFADVMAAILLLRYGGDVNWVSMCPQVKQKIDLMQVGAPESHNNSLEFHFIYVDIVYMFQATVIFLV